MVSFIVLLICYTASLIFFLNEVRKPDYKKTYLVRKTIQSLAFLAVLALSWRICGQTFLFLQLLPAFLCCLIGDVLLALYNKFRKKRMFATGLCVFLAGHLFFLHRMSSMQTFAWTDLIFPACGVVIAAVMTGSKSFHTGRLRPCILIYTFFVSALFAKSVHVAWSMPDAFHVTAAVGCLLFFASDFSILFLYFYKTRDIRIHLFNLASYYMGMFFLASCMLFA